MRVHWTDEALECVARIESRLNEFSSGSGTRWGANVMERMDLLELFPYRGRVIPEIAVETIRELLLGDYRAWYRITVEQIEVLGVFHGGMSMDELAQ